MQNPLVSAVIPTRNRTDLLRRALQSVVDQRYTPMEVVIVDDGSSDQTEAVAQEFGQKMELVYLKNEIPMGAPAARNRGIEAARGIFIAGLDDDDTWHEERISTLMAAYSDDYAATTSDTTMVYPHGQAVWRKKKVIDLDTLLLTNQVGNQVLVRRDRLLAVDGFDPHLAAAQDYDLWVRLCAEFGPIRNVQKPLQTIYMDHEEGRITGHSSFKGYLQFYQKHKHRMNRMQRKYQLYKIRRAQEKPESAFELLKWVPSQRYHKEIKRWLADRFWK